MSILRRIANLFHRSRLDREIEAELRSHIEMRAADNVAAGMSPEDAAHAAQRALGNATKIEEDVRATWGFQWLETLGQDIRYGLRQLRRSPGFTAVAMLTLALGIGANTAIFSVVNAVLLRPLPYPEAKRIMVLGSSGKDSQTVGWASQPDFQDWHNQGTSFDAMAYYSNAESSVSIGTSAEYANGAAVSSEFFRVFSVQPQVGRLFSSDEETPGGPHAVLISDSFWEQNFARSRSAIGQTLRSGDAGSGTIVGVLPKGFRFPGSNDFWVPMAEYQQPGEIEDRSAHNYSVVGRLKAGVSLPGARAQMRTIAARLEGLYPASNKGETITVLPLQELTVRDVRGTLLLVLGAVGLVLLIACANVASLLLARGTGRGREFAIRAALGATRGRTIRQLMAESAVLGLISGGAGLLLACAAMGPLVALASTAVLGLSGVRLDAPVLLFTLAISLAASMIFGLAPALRGSRPVNDTLKQAGFRTPTAHVSRARGALIVAEIAVCVVLVVISGLLLRSLLAIVNVPLGFRPDHVLVMRMSVPHSGLEGAKQASNLYTHLLDRVRPLPGVASVAAAQGVPAGGFMPWGGYQVRIGHGDAAMDSSAPQAGFPVVTPGYFGTLGIPIERGRDFNDADTYDTPFVTIISRSLAGQAFPHSDPIGRQIRCGLDSDNWMTVVGVVGDIRMSDPTSPPGPELYMPYLQHPRHGAVMTVIVRTPLAPGSLAEALRSTVRALNPNVPTRFTTMGALLGDSTATSRFRAMLIGLFAAVALCLAVAGVYGVMMFMVGQRTSEIGIRLALGAQPSSVLWLVLRQGLGLALIGIACGMAGAFAATRLVAGFLYGTQATDPTTFAAVCVLLLAASLAACWIPARRAMKVDPMVALRHE